jgi:xylan 1,4-beta-xylosidase
MKKLQIVVIVLMSVLCLTAHGQTAPINFKNPVLPGFSPDPSICRVNNDYYLVNSSFIWFPGIPVYHSKDLVNWQLIGHGITRPSQLNLKGVKDKDGIWAVTIRYHEGLFYLIGTASNCGGNFYMTAKDPAGVWSDPVWLKDAPGIDASIFWDDDGKCYYTGNRYDFKKAWPSQSAIWIQELDLNKQALTGQRSMLTYGYASNAAATEGPHLYKTDGKYLLLTAEGGTDYYHSIAAFHSNALLGPYIADKINPVLSHRQLGKDYPIQAVGHGDLVQTQNGEWWAVVLGKRVSKNISLTRETFLCKIQFEDGTPIFNPGYGRVLTEQQRPNLPWAPVAADAARDEFKSNELALKWHFIRVPNEKFYSLSNDLLKIKLLPEVADSLVSPAMIIQKIKEQTFEATTKLSFNTSKYNEQAGLIIYRNADSYYMLLKERAGLVLIKKDDGKKEIVAKVAYTRPEVYLKAIGGDSNINFSFGASATNMQPIGGAQSIAVIAESKANRFNGPGVGMYVTSNGKKTVNQATFYWFEYK